MPTVLTNMTADRITREREFQPVTLREDRKDLWAQVIITLEQLLEEKISGNVIINVANGGVSTIRVVEVQRIKQK